MQGYLATITSAAENEFLKTRMPSNAWIGASDAASEGTWKWVTGPEAGQTFWSGSSSGSAVNGAYANWSSSQPNNSNGGQDYGEIYATDGTSTDGKWNDRSNTEYPDGYLVEYSSTNVSDISFSKTFNITVQPGNDAPVLSSATPTLTSLNEDATQNGGQLISSIVNSSTITDVDSGAVRGGIAISALNSGNGSWEYRLNNTGNWVAMGAISSTSALLLRPADAVRFVPDEKNARPRASPTAPGIKAAAPPAPRRTRQTPAAARLSPPRVTTHPLRSPASMTPRFSPKPASRPVPWHSLRGCRRQRRVSGQCSDRRCCRPRFRGRCPRGRPRQRGRHHHRGQHRHRQLGGLHQQR
jgi:hypothetical protein